MTHVGGRSNSGREVAGGDERERDDPHRLLRVVRPVRERDEPARHELEASEDAVDLRRRALRDDPRDAEDQRERERDAEKRRDDRRDEHLVQDPLPLDDVLPARRHRRPDHPADQGVARARRQADEPRDEVPRDRPDEAGHHDVERDHLRIDDPLGDGRGDRDRDERAREVQDRRARDRQARRERSGRDARGDRVRGVVEPVREVEEERDDDDCEERGLHGSRLRRSSRRCSRSCSRPSRSCRARPRAARRRPSSGSPPAGRSDRHGTTTRAPRGGCCPRGPRAA